MEELKELVEIGMSGRIGRIEIFEPESSDVSLSHRLYYALKRGELHSEEDARKLLYGGSRQGFKFNMLKKRLKERLFTTILFVQPRQNIPGGYLSNAYFCYKHYVISKILIMIFARKLGTRLMRKTMKRALEYEVFDVAMLCAIGLRHYTFIQGDLSKFNSLDNIFRSSLDMVTAEAESERLYHGLLIQFIKSGAVKAGQVEQAKNAVEKLGELSPISTSCSKSISLKYRRSRTTRRRWISCKRIIWAL